MLSLLIAVPSIQKSLTSSFMGGTFSFISLLFSFDGEVGTRFSDVLSELLFLWLLLDRSKTDFSISFLRRSALHSEGFGYVI